MTISAQSKTSLQTEAVKLNAENPDLLAKFYNTAIGLNVLDASEGYYALGTPNGKVLIELYKTTTPKNADTTGMYHLALLLPTYEDLGTVLRHLVVNNVRLIGASDHGYSNALYLDDPEGNGIEIYWDKPESEWNVLEDGQIVGVTEPMDADAAIEAARTKFDGMPNRTIMGHVHLHVDDVEESADFYGNVMGLGLKYKFGPQAFFFASGDYHHHLGANIWKQGNLNKPNRLAQGIQTVEWSGTKEDIEYITAQLEEANLASTMTDGVLVFKDTAGIEHSVFER